MRFRVLVLIGLLVGASVDSATSQVPSKAGDVPVMKSNKGSIKPLVFDPEDDKSKIVPAKKMVGKRTNTKHQRRVVTRN